MELELQMGKWDLKKVGLAAFKIWRVKKNLILLVRKAVFEELSLSPRKSNCFKLPEQQMWTIQAGSPRGLLPSRGHYGCRDADGAVLQAGGGQEPEAFSLHLQHPVPSWQTDFTLSTFGE